MLFDSGVAYLAYVASDYVASDHVASVKQQASLLSATITCQPFVASPNLSFPTALRVYLSFVHSLLYRVFCTEYRDQEYTRATGGLLILGIQEGYSSLPSDMSCDMLCDMTSR